MTGEADWSCASQPRTAGHSLQHSAEEVGSILKRPKRAWPCPHLAFGLPASRLGRQHVRCLKPPHFVAIVPAALGNEYPRKPLESAKSGKEFHSGEKGRDVSHLQKLHGAAKWT